MAGVVIRSMVQRCDAQGRDKLFELTAVWVCMGSPSIRAKAIRVDMR